MAPIRLVALDLDGTLLNEEKIITEGNLEALAGLRAAGVLMVPVTGRPAQGLPRQVLELPGLRYTITSNGATIRDLVTGETLLEMHLAAEKGLEVLAACAEFPMIREAFREGVGYLSQADYDALCARYAGTALLDYVLDTRQILPGTVEDFLRTDPRPIEELFFLTDSVEAKLRLRERLSKVQDIGFADPFPRDLEVIAGGIDKGEGLRFLLDRLGISPEEVLAMGDGGSDIPLLQAAGIGVAMENATDGVKAAADFVTTSCDHDGVAAALKKFVPGL